MGAGRWSGRPVVVVGDRDASPAPAPGIDVVSVGELERFDPDTDEVPEAVVVHGDDATLRLALSAVAATSVAFGVAASAGAGPLGTLLAGSLEHAGHGPTNGDRRRSDEQATDDRDVVEPQATGPDGDAVTRVLDAPLRRLDLGRIDDERFLTSASFGLGRLVPDHTEDQGVATPVRVMRRVVRRWRRRGRITVHVDGVQRWRGRTPVVLVANAPQVIVGDRVVTVAGLDADPADGELDVAVLAPRRPDHWLLMWWRELIGAAHDPGDPRVHRGHWVHLHAEDALPLEVDGDRFRPVTIVDLHADPGALVLLDTMVAPPVGPGTDHHESESVHDDEPDHQADQPADHDTRGDPDEVP